jgi:hypothetical protein
MRDANNNIFRDGSGAVIPAIQARRPKLRNGDLFVSKLSIHSSPSLTIDQQV